MQNLIGKIVWLRKCYNFGDKQIDLYYYINTSIDSSNKEIGGPYTGKGLSKKEAKANAAFETLERYYAQLSKTTKNIIKASFNKVRDLAVNPRDLILPENFPIRYNANLKIGWVWDYSLGKKDWLLVPVDFVFHSFSKKVVIEEFYNSHNIVPISYFEPMAWLLAIV